MGFYTANKSIKNQRNIGCFIYTVISPFVNTSERDYSTDARRCMISCVCTHYYFISSLFKIWSFMRVPLVTGGSIGTTRESAESNKVIGKHIIKQFRTFDIHDSEGNHVEDRSRLRSVIEGKASAVDVVHFDESLRYLGSCNCSDGDLLVELSPFYVVPDFPIKKLI